MDRPDYTTSNTSEKQGGFSWGFFLVGILFVVAAMFAFFNPSANLTAFTYVFAIMAIVYGIWLISRRFASGLSIFAGALDIIIGIFMLFNIGWAVLALPIVFAVWFIVDSVFRLFNLGYVRTLGTGYFWFSLIANILGIVIGILLLFNPLAAVLTFSYLVGFYLLLAGIECIVLAFSKPAAR